METYRAHQRFIAYVLVFLFTLHFTLPIYVNSTYLSSFTGETLVGSIYTLASLLTIVAFIASPSWLRRYGNYKMLCAVIAVEMLALIGLAYSTSVWFVVLFFVASSIAIALGNFNIDIFVERFSSTETTGSIRGIFLTSTNFAWAISPAVAGFILTYNSYNIMYMIGAAILLPVLFLIQHHLSHFKDVAYEKTNIKAMWQAVQNNNNIKEIIIVGFLLQFFYAWMVIYTPIYLRQYIGFDWSDIGTVFSLMLVAYLVTQLPLGYIADKKLGEKEIMTVGFVIMAVATACITYVSLPKLGIWIAILFVTRLGASMVEIMADTYFFKKVSSKEVHLISVWRSLRPVAYVISPIVATVFLFAFDLKYIFLLLGFLMLFGVRYSLAIEDTL